MAEPPIARVRREHEAVQEMLCRLEAIAAAAGGVASTGALPAALDELVETCDRCVSPHLEMEEHSIYARLDTCLPAETGTVGAAMREHETLRELMSLLRQRAERLGGGDPNAQADVAETIRDLAALWSAHAHRVDDVVGPLLKSLGEEPSD